MMITSPSLRPPTAAAVATVAAVFRTFVASTGTAPTTTNTTTTNTTTTITSTKRTTWNPQHYLQFQNQQLRPALDLLAQIPDRNHGHCAKEHQRIVDLGCGPGHVTPFLLHRFAALTSATTTTGQSSSPQPSHGSQITMKKKTTIMTCVDSSPEMLQRVQQYHEEQGLTEHYDCQLEYVLANFESFAAASAATGAGAATTPLSSTSAAAATVDLIYSN
ncbi:hypothetical protein ACA910_020942 [Epithemia clementina (nom. ined.)]